MAVPSPAKQKYEPRDQLLLWWLAEPSSPRLIGELNLVRSSRGSADLELLAEHIERPFLREQRSEYSR
jgi:hypothetical protein